MSEPKFTPGPWVGQVDGKYPESDWVAEYEGPASSGCSVAINSPDGYTVALAVVTGFQDAILEANAHLIAAAPDLYAVLEAIVRYAGNNGDDYLADKARVALAKARGKG